MEVLKPNLIISGTTIGLGIISKIILDFEFIKISSVKNILFSFSILTISSVIGKTIIDESEEKRWINFVKKYDEKQNEEEMKHQKMKDALFVKEVEKERELELTSIDDFWQSLKMDYNYYFGKK